MTPHERSEQLRYLDLIWEKERMEEMQQGGGNIRVKEVAYYLLRDSLGDIITVVTPDNLLAAAELVRSGRAKCYMGGDGDLCLEPVIPIPTSS